MLVEGRGENTDILECRYTFQKADSEDEKGGG